MGCQIARVRDDDLNSLLKKRIKEQHQDSFMAVLGLKIWVKCHKWALKAAVNIAVMVSLLFSVFLQSEMTVSSCEMSRFQFFGPKQIKTLSAALQIRRVASFSLHVTINWVLTASQRFWESFVRQRDNSSSLESRPCRYVAIRLTWNHEQDFSTFLHLLWFSNTSGCLGLLLLFLQQEKNYSSLFTR